MKARAYRIIGANLLLVTAIGSSALAAMPEAFLKTAWQDPEVLAGKTSDYEPESSWSPFREVEVFGGTENGSHTSSVEAGFGLDIKSLREMQETWKSNSAQQASFLRDVRFAQALRRRYYLLIDYFQSQKLLRHLQDHGEALERNLRAQNIALRFGKSKAQDILKAQVALSTIQRETREAAAAYESTKAQIKAIFPDFKESSFAFRNFITPEEIAAQRQLFKPAPATVSARVLEAQLNTLKSEQEVSLARQSAWIKGLKFSVEGKGIDQTDIYDSKKYDTIFKASISFRLPFLGDDLIAIQSRPERLEKVYEKEREFQVLTSRSKSDPGLLKALIDSYSQISRTLGSLARVERSIVDPQVALDTVLAVRAARSELLALEKEILVSYVDLLYEQSVLLQQPDVNHLSSMKVKI